MSPGSMLFLSREDLLELGADDMSLAVPCVRQAFDAWRTNGVLQPAKTTLKYAGAHEKYGGLVNVLPAALRDNAGTVFGLKALGAMPSNVERGLPRASGVIVLFDGETKTPMVMMDAQVISAMRTGAVSAIAARELCRKDSVTLGLVGAGVNMRTQLLGLLYALPDVRVVKVFSRGNSKFEFVRTMKKRFPHVTFEAQETARGAVIDADVVVTCVANSDSPVVAAADIDREGVTVFNIGCLENEPGVLKNMDVIVSDHWEHSKHRGVQTHAVAYQQGIIKDEDVTNLGDILSGVKPGRTTEGQRVFFCPTGLGVEDVAMARGLMGRALARGQGTPLRLWEGQSWI